LKAALKRCTTWFLSPTGDNPSGRFFSSWSHP
jgi:hypothetical protein